MKPNYLMIAAFFALFAAGVLFAQVQAPTSAEALRLATALGQICGLAAAILPVVAFVLFVLAGLAYAAGNFFGADARAKSVGWAMNMITGAVIAFLLWIVGPLIISGLSGGTVTYSPGQMNCGFPT